jgi:flagellar basal body-associated protein FliL
MRNQKGITLIALVITIIVLLILAGVTIAMLSGENGILSRSTQTKAENAKAEANEQARLAYMAVRTDIAAKKTQNGAYSPSANTLTANTAMFGANDKSLEDLVKTDLNTTAANSKWAVSAAATASPATNSSTITMVYTDSSLPGDHTRTYTIVVADAASPVAQLTSPAD